MIGIQSRLLIGAGAALALLTVGWQIDSRAFDRGVAKERATWQAAAQELRDLRQQRADWSAARLAERLDALDTSTTKEIVRVETRFRDRPDGPCLDADLVRDLEAARARIRAPASRPSGDSLPAGPSAAAAGDEKSDDGLGAAK